MCMGDKRVNTGECKASVGMTCGFLIRRIVLLFT